MLLYYWRTPIMDGLDPSKPKLLPSLADPYKKHLNCQPMVKFFLLWQSTIKHLGVLLGKISEVVDYIDDVVLGATRRAGLLHWMDSRV